VYALRCILLRYPALAGAVLAIALALKLLIPAGFMPVTASDGTITVQICSGMQSGPVTMQMTIPGLPAGHGDQQKSDKADMPCAFSGLAMSMVSAVDPLLLTLAIAFIIALASRAPAILTPKRRAFLRPPLRGPPLTT
jgi:hypothetical protein